MKTTYITKATSFENYTIFPNELFKVNLKPISILVYITLIKFSTISRKNGFIDKNGNVFAKISQATLAEILNKSVSTIKLALNELKNAGLIEIKRRGQGLSNLTYVLIPQNSTNTQKTANKTPEHGNKEEDFPEYDSLSFRQPEEDILDEELLIDNFFEGELF